MERIMTLDEEDIIKLIAKSVGVNRKSVKLRLSAETFLTNFDDQEDDDKEEISDECFVDATFKIYAKVNLPITQIDGTEVEYGESYEDEEEDEEKGPDDSI